MHLLIIFEYVKAGNKVTSVVHSVTKDEIKSLLKYFIYLPLKTVGYVLKQFRVIAERIVRTNSLTRRSRGQCLSNSTIVHLFACSAFTNTVTALLWQIIIFSMTFELGYVKQMKVEYGNLTASKSRCKICYEYYVDNLLI